MAEMRQRAVFHTSSANPTTATPTAAQLALQLGWIMAALHDDSSYAPNDGSPQRPIMDRLPAGERKQLEMVRLRHLLRMLADNAECAGSGLPTDLSGLDENGLSFKGQLEALNLSILKSLMVTIPEFRTAYELGMSLYNTVNPANRKSGAKSLKDELARLLEHSRITQLQRSLAILSAQFPQHVTAIVSASLGRWSELTAMTVSTLPTQLSSDDSNEFAGKMCSYLQPQGDLWLTLLTGTRSTTDLISSQGYIAAREAALHRSTKIVRQLIQRYWIAMFILAATVGGFLYLTVTSLSGGAKAWTAIGIIAGALGISARAIICCMARLGVHVKRPVFSVEEEDSMAWAVTALPRARLTRRGVQQLRRAGVARTTGTD